MNAEPIHVRYAVLIQVLALAASAMPAAAQADTLMRSSVRSFAAVAASVGHARKGEFETTAAFQERLRARLDTSMVTIEIDASVVTVAYDADRERFSVEPLTRTLLADPAATEYIALTTREVDRTIGTRRASNAFGATVSVTDRASERWAVASTIPTGGFADRSAAANFAAAPAQARLLKSSLRFFVSGRLAIGPGAEPSAILTSSDDATISSPIQRAITTHVLWMDAPELQVIDVRTRKILARVGF